MTGADAVAKTRNWTNAKLVYDDGDISYICGVYRGSEHKSLGIRWNVSEGTYETGFPVSRNGSPNWLVLPQYLNLDILTALLRLIEGDAGLSSTEKADAHRSVIEAMSEVLSTQN